MKKLVLVSVVSVLFFALSMESTYSAPQHTIPVDQLTSDMDTLNSSLSGGTLQLYARSRWLTPFFYLADFQRHYGSGTGGSLILDDWAQVDPLEYVALTNTAMRVHRILSHSGVTLLDVTTAEYPYDSETDRHYIDARMVRVIQSETAITKRQIKLPSRYTIQSRMRQQLGTPYIWGGNSPVGSSRMLELYPSANQIDALTQAKWTMSGFDCSGLLFWATNGYTPRNTSKLITYGTGIDIEWKTPEDIAKILKPLDVIVWRWHDRIVLDKGHIIESTANFSGTGNYSTPNGVRIVPLIDSLREIIEEKKRTPVNDWDTSTLERKSKFVIRRWYP